MIKRMIFAGIFFCLCIAIPLAFMGVEKVEIGGPVMAFLKATSIDMSKWQLKIPEIPSIELQENVSGFGLVLDLLARFVNMVILWINGFVKIVNIIINLIQYIATLLKNLITLKDTIAHYPILFE